MKPQLRMSLCGMLLFGAIAFTCGGKEGSVFYVSQSGSDSWTGTLAAPNNENTDGPFATLEKARDAIGELKKSTGLPNGGVTVYLRKGTYHTTKQFALSAEDSGTEEAPVVWSAYPDEEVYFSGGIIISGFAPVRDAAILKRIDKTYHDKIVQANLSDQGIGDYGDINPARGNRIELYFKKKFMTIARYPNEGWLTIADVPQTGKRKMNEGLDRDKSPVPRGRHYGRFAYTGDRPMRWKNVDNIWMHGYWVWDWRDEYLPVERIDTNKREIDPREPHHSSGYQKGQRFYFLNILEELDSPGEWYLDARNGMLYFFPPSPIGDGDVIISLFKDAIISLRETSYITIQGIIFEGSRGSAIEVSGGSHNIIAGCTFQNLGQTAVIISGGNANGALSCDMHDIASGGVILDGGDRKTLTPAGNYADNNHIHDFGIRLKTYTPAVQITGVGNRAAHNLIHDSPHTGIFLVTSRVGNNHVIEYNELHSLAKETGDVGAIYLCARNYTFRGTIIRYNYLHHLVGPGLYGVMGVYLDDFTSGTTVFGNVFYKAGRAGFIGGGRNNTIENNIFVECEPSVHLDARGLGWAQSSFKNNMEQFRNQLNEMDYTKPPYSEQYPELLALMDDEPPVPKYNAFIRNVSFGGRWFDLYDRLDFSLFTMKDNYIADTTLCKWLKQGEKSFKEYAFGDETIMKELKGNTVVETEPGFMNMQKENFQLKDDSPAWKLGFKPIPFERIGLYVDEYRKALPQ